MAESYSSSEPWVLFRLNKQIYGIPASNTQEMITIPVVTPIPRSPEYVRGLINLRGSVIAMIDLRLKLGQISMHDEVDSSIKIMYEREKDHVAWVDALQQTIDTGVPFTKTRDPRQCAFGRWYEERSAENPQLIGLFLRFDVPHRAIHAAADVVEDFLRNGEQEKAREYLKSVRDQHLATMTVVFKELEEGILKSRQEVAIVVEHSNIVLAITVDAVESVETLQANSIEDLPGDIGADKNYIVSMLGRRSSDNSPVLIPDLGRIVNDASYMADSQAASQLSAGQAFA